MRNRSLLLFAICLLLIGCKEKANLTVNFYSTELFKDVQLSSVFADSKTFVDCVPKRPVADIAEDYLEQKDDEGFVLKTFVLDNFNLPKRPQSTFVTDTTLTLESHLTNLWSVLTRRPDEEQEGSSLIPLPYPYIVPGGRFSEIYYWDSYFTMLGLKAQGRFDMMKNMLDNFAFLIDSLGFVPNGNRNYYLSRSQPPFFSLMVKEYQAKDSLAALHYLPAMLREYEFWMHGSEQLRNPGDALERVVMLSGDFVLNRYWDATPEPRPEAFKEDTWLANDSERAPEDLYRNLRAAAESGWDFSSRWLREGSGLESIRTVEIIPVDLNSLLYHLEMMIALGLELKGEKDSAAVFIEKASHRKSAILTLCWNTSDKFFYDYNHVEGSTTGIKTLAGLFPLYFHLADDSLISSIENHITKEFLQPGGLTTTLRTTGEQWDAPNGWAPLHWIAYQGFKNYRSDLAEEIKKRWLRQNVRVYKATGKMMEKYNVTDTTLLAGGGEYPNQDGFGWTNGVALALIESDE